MNKQWNITMLAAVLVALVACSGGGAPAAAGADSAAIKAVNVAWNKAYNAGDGAAVAALYADDAVLSAPGVAPLRGTAAITAYYLKDAPATVANGITTADGDASDIGQSGDLAWQWGTYQNTNKAGAVVETGKFLSVFERRGGKWMIVRDMWNADTAAAPATAPTAAQ
jgi:uncharacterized protein (TIGR02246 family)